MTAPPGEEADDPCACSPPGRCSAGLGASPAHAAPRAAEGPGPIGRIAGARGRAGHASASRGRPASLSSGGPSWVFTFNPTCPLAGPGASPEPRRPGPCRSAGSASGAKPGGVSVDWLPRGDRRPGWRKAWPIISAALPALLMPPLILGGIFTGIVTPTEAAVVAAQILNQTARFRNQRSLRLRRTLGLI